MMATSRLISPAAIVVAFLAGTLTTAAFTQGTRPQAPPPVMVVDYMKVPPGQGDAYLRIERELFMPMHRDLIRRGQKRSWELYAVQFPAGTRRDYDFVTINVYDSIGALDTPTDYAEIARRVHPRVPVDTIFRQTIAARDLVRSEVWRRLERAQ
jgi:hypothetical protein